MDALKKINKNKTYRDNSFEELQGQTGAKIPFKARNHEIKLFSFDVRKLYAIDLLQI
jgi:hypothetical protein